MAKRKDRAAVACLRRAADEARMAAYWENHDRDCADSCWAAVVSWLFAGLADTRAPGYVAP